MSEDQNAIEGKILDEDDIDLDFDDEEEDALLREAIASPIVVKIRGQVITVPHMLDWEHEHTLLGNQSNWDGWAKGVLSEADYETFTNGHLKNYQIEAIVKKASRRAGTTPGKSRRSSRSSKSTGRR